MANVLSKMRKHLARGATVGVDENRVGVADRDEQAFRASSGFTPSFR